MSSEFLASSWKNFHGRSILNHTPVLCGTVSWVKKFVVRLSTTKITKMSPLPPPPKCPHPSLRQVWEGGLAGEPVRDNAGPRVLRAGQQGQPEVREGGRERERERGGGGEREGGRERESQV